MNMEKYDFENNVLMKVREGAKVLDKDHKEIGTVDDVFLGAVDQDTQDQASGPSTDGTSGRAGRESYTPNFAFGGAIDINDDFSQAEGGTSETIRNRLLRHGYVHVDTGLFKADKLVLSEQIKLVEEEKLILNVSADQLLRDDILA
ncbi:MAG: hypothetical protein EHM41_21095 [Chloroflexi bacterium]|nr:MAG: hypothetical protein EHM41_21095 [Chloroflexota bacterium]